VTNLVDVTLVLLVIFMLAAPVLVAVADWMLWDTRLSPRQWAGATLCLIGLAALIRLAANYGGSSYGDYLRELAG
jgi:drug/metabolite transporter (DMT)-like permease